jgi:hypothetical protein
MFQPVMAIIGAQTARYLISLSAKIRGDYTDRQAGW